MTIPNSCFRRTVGCTVDHLMGRQPCNATNWTFEALDRYSLGMLVTPEEADALVEIGEVVPEEQLGYPPA